jgi:RNA polymerase sigma factor (sigma-70 family)
MARPARNARQGRQPKTETRNPDSPDGDIVVAAVVRCEPAAIVSTVHTPEVDRIQGVWPVNADDETLNEERLEEHICRVTPSLKVWLDNPSRDLDDARNELRHRLWENWTEITTSTVAYARKVARTLAIAFNTLATREKIKTEQNTIRVLCDVIDRQHQIAKTSEIVETMMSQLDDEQKKLLTWLYFEGMSYSEIAQATGLTEANVGAKLTRIRTLLREKFGPELSAGVSTDDFIFRFAENDIKKNG